MKQVKCMNLKRTCTGLKSGECKMKAECVFRAGLKDCKKQIINKLK